MNNIIIDVLLPIIIVMHYYGYIYIFSHTLCIHVLWGHPIGVMVFILYKLYFLSPYT